MKTVRGVFEYGAASAGATQERTQKVLDEMTDYFLTKEKDNVEPCLRLTALASRVVVRTPVSPSFL